MKQKHTDAKHAVRSLADNPNLIRGIFNYCDIWCERCAHTAQCLNFQMQAERERRRSRKTAAAEPAEVLDQIGESFELVREMIDDLLEREGITLTEADLATAAQAENLDDERVARHPCSRAAYAYGDLVETWFKTGATAWRAKVREIKKAANLRLPGRAPGGELAELNEACEVVRYYQHFLYPKIGRALRGRLDGDPCGDASGSAKIALIAMDRSLGAWSRLLAHFPEREAATLPLLIHLEKLRRAVEKTFPKARAFLRPGLDEPAS